jgi:Zn-dependent peptidase ImmA (M78 family)
MASSRGSLLALGVRDDLGLGAEVIDVFAVIRAIGIRLHLAPGGESTEDLEGMFIRRDGVGWIYVNTDAWPRRQRMTAAHELGHHFLAGDDVQNLEIEDWDGRSLEQAEERDAFDFAREFLMDRSWLRENCAGLPADDAIDRAVRQFEVSPEAAAVQLCVVGVLSNTDKDGFLSRQRDQQTRRRFGNAGQRTHVVLLDSDFDRRVKALEQRDVLGTARAAELRDHAVPTVVDD